MHAYKKIQGLAVQKTLLIATPLSSNVPSATSVPLEALAAILPNLIDKLIIA